MNAPEQITDAEFRLIPLDQLIPSPTNPRKRFDAAKLQELAASIKVQGVLQPILVRVELWDDGQGAVENRGRFEIIAGERRYRAARIAGLAEMPCTIRNLTDQQVLHAQVIENLQRDDLHPLEEAEGYERLMKEKDADGKPYTVDSIAAEIGKSRAYVYARTKLLDLCKEARDAFFEDKIVAEIALLIARVPVHTLQVKALKGVLGEMPYGNSFMAAGDKMSVRKAREYMQENFMLDLTRKVFDTADATLLPKAGACTECPKRTGNSPDLFDDVKSPDTCTDPTCFALKKTAAVKRLQEEAEGKGCKFVSGNQAKKLIPTSYRDAKEHLLDHGLATLDSKIPDDAEGRTYAQAIKQAGLIDARIAQGDEKKASVQKIVVQNPYNLAKTHTVINIEEATKALREAGFDITPKASAGKPADNGRKESDAHRVALAMENAYRAKLFDAVHGKIADAMSDPAHPVFEKISAMMCAEFIDLMTDSGNYSDDALATILGKYAELPNLEEIEFYDWVSDFSTNVVPTLNNTQHFLLMVDLLFTDDLNAHYRVQGTFSDPARLVDIAAICGLDHKAVKKDAAKEHKAMVAAEAKKGGEA